jgi:hypothetical protein
MVLVKYFERRHPAVGHAVSPWEMEDLGKGGALAQSTDAKVEGYESNERDEQKRVVQVYFDSCCCVYVPWYHHRIVSWLMFAFPCT